jgi:hypothetical protein
MSRVPKKIMTFYKLNVMNLQMSLLAVVCHTDKTLNLNDEFQVSPMPPAPSPSAPFSTHTKTFPYSWISCSICFTCWPNVHVQHTCPFIYSMYWAFPERCCWHAGAHIFFIVCSNSTPGCESSLSNVHNVRNSRNNVSVVTGWDESMKPWFVQGVRCKARLCFFPFRLARTKHPREMSTMQTPPFTGARCWFRKWCQYLFLAANKRRPAEIWNS